MSSSSDNELFVPDQQFVSNDDKLKIMREDQDKILNRYEEELRDFTVAQENMEQLKNQKKTELRHNQEEVRQMQEQINIYKTRQANLIFTHERIMIRKMSKLWFFSLIPLYLFMLHFYYKGAYSLVVLNTVAFLANWRMLYVLHADYTPMFGFIVILISWFVGTNAIWKIKKKKEKIFITHPLHLFLKPSSQNGNQTL